MANRLRGESKWTNQKRAFRSKNLRYCKICGSTADKVRILKHENICEICVKNLSHKKEGHFACKICGKVVPKQVKENKGYCSDCVCRICGKPDPKFTKEHGLCRECLTNLGTNCRICGKEAMAQVKKNNGICDACLNKKEK